MYFPTELVDSIKKFFMRNGIFLIVIIVYALAGYAIANKAGAFDNHDEKNRELTDMLNF